MIGRDRFGLSKPTRMSVAPTSSKQPRTEGVRCLFRIRIHMHSFGILIGLRWISSRVIHE